MSLLRSVIRCTAVAAMRDQTWVEDRVYDSDLRPLVDAVLNVGAKTYMVVYTDQDDLANMSSEFYNGMNRKLCLTLEIGVAGAVKNPADRNSIVIKFARNDPGMELACDLIEAQAIAAIWGRPKSPWGEIFKRLVPKVADVRRRRGGSGEEGAKWAARRIQIICNTIAEPQPGEVLPDTHPVKLFLAAATTSVQEQTKSAGSVIQRFLEDTVAPDWRIAQGWLGVTTRAAQNLILPTTPLPWPEIEIPPLDFSETNEFVPPTGEIIMADNDDNDKLTPVPTTDPTDHVQS